MTATRLLWPAVAVLSFAGIGLRLAPSPLPAAKAPIVPPPQPLPAVSALVSGAEIVAGNMFAASRSAPRLRFAPRGLVAPPAVSVPTPLRLYGITVTPDGALALIDADPLIPGAEIYRVGDRVRGSELVAITDSTVTLRTAAGAPLLLHLPPSDRRQP